MSLATILFLIFASLFLTSPAHAYVDPGSGSFLMQIIAASMIGIAFHFRRFFKKILFWKNKNTSSSSESQES